MQAVVDESIDEYIGLVREFPLVHIGDDAQP